VADPTARQPRRFPAAWLAAVSVTSLLAVAAWARDPDVAGGEPAATESVAAEAVPLRAASGGEHRWFIGPVADAAGVGIGHQGPEMPSDAFRILATMGGGPRLLAAFGNEAWIVADPPVPGGQHPVFSVRVARNPVHGIWYPTGTMAVRPAGRLPAGIRPRLAAATPAGPIILAEPAGAGEPWQLLRSVAGQWTRWPVAGDMADETPVGLAVVRLPDRSPPEPAPEPAPEPDAAPTPAGDRGEDAAADPPGLLTVTLLLVHGPDGPALDLVGRGGERQRIWRGGPAWPGPDPLGPGDGPPSLVIAGGRPWIVAGVGDRLLFEPLPVAIDPREAVATGAATADAADGPRRFEVPRPAGPFAVTGGDGIILVEGARLVDADDAPRMRSWTAGGGEDREGRLEPVEVDPSVILRGPIILGTGIFVAVMVAVLGSRPGPRPEAITGREAPVGRRLLAAAIDAIPPLAAAALVFGWTPSVLLASMMLLHPAGLVPWAGFTLLWSFATVVGDLAGGRTPGRLLLGLRLVDAEGRPLGRAAAMARFLLRTLAVAFPPLILFWLAHARGRAVHDLATGSWVIRSGPPSQGRRTDPGPPDR
jgi:uncharacterized RDD family membrane protein YckC